MNLNAPSQTLFIVAVVIAVVALLGAIIAIPFVSAYAFWILLLAFIILVAGVMMKGS
jgi:Na+(H+)/acetate symporter ActP